MDHKGNNNDNDDVDRNVEWQVKLEGGFGAMDETIATKVEAAYQAEIASINLKMGEWMYCIDIGVHTRPLHICGLHAHCETKIKVSILIRFTRARSHP